MPSPIPYPMINGNRFDFSSVILTVGGINIEGCKSIEYSDELKPGEIRGTSAQVQGRTRGKYTPTASMELYKTEADLLIALLSPGVGIASTGYMEVPFDISVAYNEPLSPVITDSLIGVRITKAADNGKEGEEALAVKFDLNPIVILRNNRSAVLGSRASL